MRHHASIRWATLLGATAANVTLVIGQARIVFNDNSWLRIDNGAWVVVEEPGTVGVQTLGTGGNLRSEGEFNRLRWQIRNSTGVYTIPFTTANGVKMPFTYEALGGASNEAQASICFSTYNYGAIAGNNWDNNTYRPSDVTHMHNWYVGPPSNNSDNVVDRFWLVDPYAEPAFAYSAKPSIRLGFTYDPGAATGDVRTGNAITGATAVGAQRFNPGPQWWGDYWPSGTFAAGAVNSVTDVNATPADFFRSWTLSNLLQPLPVELMRFDADCDDGRVRLSWTTASEHGSSHFVIERSSDGESYSTIGQVQAAGQSANVIDYTFLDERPLGVAYYRLQLVDLDGSKTESPTAFVRCGNGSTALVNAWDGDGLLNLLIASQKDQPASLRVTDAAGKLVAEQRSIGLIEGMNEIALPHDAAVGLYTVSVLAGDALLTRKVLLGHR
ncbi:MAG: hypothetical protein IPM12_07480 [Flavobacteriales bacterium]|nr:hypothetical protein [Flavobacteriales bacterium]